MTHVIFAGLKKIVKQWDMENEPQVLEKNVFFIFLATNLIPNNPCSLEYSEVAFLLFINISEKIVYLCSEKSLSVIHRIFSLAMVYRRFPGGR